MTDDIKGKSVNLSAISTKSENGLSKFFLECRKDALEDGISSVFVMAFNKNGNFIWSNFQGESVPADTLISCLETEKLRFLLEYKLGIDLGEDA